MVTKRQSKPAISRTRESVIQKQILEALSAKGLTAFRINSGAFRVGARFVRAAPPGWPDVVLIIEGHLIGIEVKGTGGKQSPQQKAMQAQFEYCGATYWLVYSAAEVVDLVDKRLRGTHIVGGKDA